MYLKAS